MPRIALLVAVPVRMTGPDPPVEPETPESADGLPTAPDTEAPVLPELVELD